MIIKRLGMKRDKNFEKLYTLMAQDLGMDRMPYIVYQLDGSHWLKLLQHSERHYSFCDRTGLLFPVLHKIHWKQYPECAYTDLQKEMLAILEDVIRTDTIAKATWINDDYFLHQVCMMRVSQTAYTKNEPYYLSGCHESYMNGRGNNIMYYTSVEQDENEKDTFPEVYEAIIKEILPEAHTWPEEAWNSEKQIYQGLAEKYGVTYPGVNEFADAEEYSSLIVLLQYKYEGKPYDINHLALLDVCTMGMAAVLWPQDTERKMIEEFLRIGKAVQNGEVSSLAMSLLGNCWLCRQVCTWLENGGIPSELSHAVKEASFTMALFGC